MHKHPTDHQNPHQEDNLLRLWQFARKDDPHFWLTMLRRRPQPAGPDRRLPEYLRIARGHRA